MNGFGHSTAGKAVWADKTQEKLDTINGELQQLRESGIIKTKGNIVLPPSIPDELIFKEHALSRMIERDISFSDAFDIADNAIFAIQQRHGTQHVFYSDNGFIAITNAGDISSVGRLDDAGKKIVEVVRKHGFNNRQNSTGRNA